MPGYRDLAGLGNGIYENEVPSYTLREQKEEDKLFQRNISIRSLIEDLEDSLITEQTENEDQT